MVLVQSLYRPQFENHCFKHKLLNPVPSRNIFHMLSNWGLNSWNRDAGAASAGLMFHGHDSSVRMGFCCVRHSHREIHPSAILNTSSHWAGFNFSRTDMLIHAPSCCLFAWCLQHKHQDTYAHINTHSDSLTPNSLI